MLERLYAFVEEQALGDDSTVTSLALVALYRAFDQPDRAAALADRASARIMAEYDRVSPDRAALWPLVNSGWHHARQGRFAEARAALRDYVVPMGQTLFSPDFEGPRLRTEFGFYLPAEVELRDPSPVAQDLLGDGDRLGVRRGGPEVVLAGVAPELLAQRLGVLAGDEDDDRRLRGGPGRLLAHPDEPRRRVADGRGR